MLKFQILILLFISVIFASCQYEGTLPIPTILEGQYKGFYKGYLHTSYSKPIKMQFERDRIRFSVSEFTECEGSFQISDSTLLVTQTREEFCACHCCGPAITCYTLSMTNTKFIFKLINGQLTISGSPPGLVPVVFNLEKIE
jgi:hypothetical protein